MTHLRKTMLEELQRRNLSKITTRLYLRAVEETPIQVKLRSPPQPHA
jgi:hypothetical protein